MAVTLLTLLWTSLNELRISLHITAARIKLDFQIRLVIFQLALFACSQLQDVDCKLIINKTKEICQLILLILIEIKSES